MNIKFLLLALAYSLSVYAPAVHAGPFSVSQEKERKIGQQAAAQIEQSSLLVSGPVYEWVNRIGARLAAKSDPKFQYSFHVIDSPEINAFCLPAGHIYVYTGLRKICRTDDELAAVLAHEITHAENNHYAKQSKKANERGTLLGIGSILLGLPPLAAQAVSILDASISAKYSREHEYEADREGLFRMKEAGFDAKAMATVLERLAHEDDADGLDRWMADHPEGKKRVVAVKALIPTLK